MKLLIVMPMIAGMVFSLKLSDKCSSLKGKYSDQKCYLYVNHTVLNWKDAMEYCNTVVPGYNGHLAHILSSKTLATLKDLTRPIPTESAGAWGANGNYAFIGARVDGSNSVATLSHANARFATAKDTLVDDVSVADTYLGTLSIVQDFVRDTRDWALIVWIGSSLDIYNWERGEISDVDTKYFFCQINEQYSSMVNTKVSRVLKVPLLNGYTVANELDCLEERSMHKLCRGFNYNSIDGSSELTSWDPGDVASNEIEQNSSWRFYIPDVIPPKAICRSSQKDGFFTCEGTTPNSPYSKLAWLRTGKPINNKSDCWRGGPFFTIKDKRIEMTVENEHSSIVRDYEMLPVPV